jgi:hypothetical protein
MPIAINLVGASIDLMKTASISIDEILVAAGQLAAKF